MACEKQDVAQLPDDIAMEILSYLPAKSIGRFRSASSSWDAQLLPPSFVELHRRRANKPGEHKFFFSLTDEPSEEYNHFYSWRPGGGPVKKLVQIELCEPAPLTKPLHGLVLIRHDEGYDVCNPSTGEFLALPDTRLPLKTIKRYLRTQLQPPCYGLVAYGLGYCSVNQEYKVVRLFSDPYWNDTADSRCEVFVPRAPAYWRPTVRQPPACIVEEHSAGVFLNGYLHFLCEDGDILTFDVSDETFGSLQPPPPYPEDDDPVARITDLDGCLCLCREKADSDGPYQVWVLRDYERWEQLCCFDRRAWPEPMREQLQSEWVTPLALATCNGQKKVMFGTGTCKVFSVDLDVGAPDMMLSPDVDIPGSSFEDTEEYPAIGLLEESLVPLGRIEEEMHLLSPTTEAWRDVLKWLPARSVLEMSLVCREWRVATTNFDFIESHLVHANSIKRRPRITFVIDPAFGHLCDLEDVGNLPFPPNFMAGLFHASQPCHGLNVGTMSGYDFLCNPAIHYNQRIEHHNHDDEQADPFAGRIALGYDSDDDDHVLVFLAYNEKNLDTRDYKLRCKVRCVRGDIWWLSAEPPPRPVADVPPTYADGKIYWVVDLDLGPRSDAACCELVAFDTIKREFEVVEGPPGCHGGHVSVVELHGAIHVAWSDRDADAIDVWKMKDDGVWCLECRIELAKYSPEYSSERTLLIGIDPTDGRILLNTGQSLGYYDPKTGELETVYRVPGSPINDGSTFCALVYQESLVHPFTKY